MGIVFLDELTPNMERYGAPVSSFILTAVSESSPSSTRRSFALKFNMVFAFNPNDDGWVIYGPNNSYNLYVFCYFCSIFYVEKPITCRRCPKDLSDHIVGAAEKDETVASVAISLDGSWFIKTTTHTRKLAHRPSCCRSRG